MLAAAICYELNHLEFSMLMLILLAYHSSFVLSNFTTDI